LHLSVPERRLFSAHSFTYTKVPVTPYPDVAYEHRGGLLLVTAAGVFQIDWFTALIADIAIRVRAVETTSVLVDVRGLTGSMTFVDRYRAGYKAANSGIVVPVAVVGNEPLVDPSRLGEMVARNRGANVKVFTELADAERWLGVRFT
jgi:hypothetical protein